MKRLFAYDPGNPKREDVLAFLCVFIRSAGQKVQIVVTDPIKSREQEQHYHAQINDIAEQTTLYGKKLPAESWKRLLIDAFKHDTINDPDLAPLWAKFGSAELLPALNHPGFVVVGEQSRQFGVRLARAFIEWLYAYGAECEVVWTEPKRKAA